jgi:hypothetical protein
MNYLFKREELRIPVVVLAFLVALSLGIAGFTTEASADTTVGKDNIQITKSLRVSPGQTIPDMDFIFDITPSSITTGTGDGATMTKFNGSNMPKVDPVTIGYSNIAQRERKESGGVEYIVRDSSNIVGKFSFTAAGTYVYEVTERSDTYTPTVDGEKVTYSDLKFELRFIVKQVETAYVIDSVTSWNAEGKGGLTFSNIYECPPDENTTFTIGNKVTGPYANTNPDNLFDFELTVNVAPVVTPPEDGGQRGYKAYIKDSEGQGYASDHENRYGRGEGTDGNGAYYFIVPGAVEAVQLGHDEHLEIVGLPVGSDYDIKAVARPFYAYSVTGTVGGQSAAANPPNDGYVYSNPFTDMDLSTGKVRIKNGENSAVFSSYAGDVADTGVNMDNLPYIGLIALGAVALGLYVFIRRRRRSRGY